jgi:hypothetical protein
MSSTLFATSEANAQEQSLEWKPKIDWSGDLRYRTAKSRESIDDPRPYQQLRARLGLKADVNESVQAIVRLATGTSAISTNQTIGDPSDPGMPRRNFGIDLAYIDAQFLDAGHVWAGRTANPFWSPGKLQLVFDSDLAFEGVALRWNPRWSDSSAFANIGAFMISENYTAPSDIVDTGLIGAQVGYQFTAHGEWTLHFAAHHFLNIQDRPITSVDQKASVDPYSYPFDRYRGNTVYPIDPAATPRVYSFSSGYILMEAGLEWKGRLGPLEASLFYDRVRNDLASDRGLGQEYGTVIKYGSAQVSVAYATKQSDAVVGAFTDSDTNGGGTDNKGTRVTLGYQFGKRASIALNDFRGKRGVDSVERDFSATQLDFMMSF